MGRRCCGGVGMCAVISGQPKHVRRVEPPISGVEETVADGPRRTQMHVQRLGSGRNVSFYDIGRARESLASNPNLKRRARRLVLLHSDRMHEVFCILLFVCVGFSFVPPSGLHRPQFLGREPTFDLHLSTRTPTISSIALLPMV